MDKARCWRAVLAALLLLIASSPSFAAEKRKVVIDQDAFGGPGLQPLLMVLQDPSVEVLGITIVSGDGWQAEETAAVLRMLEIVGRTDVPVIAGATFPLVNTAERTRRREAQYGALGYKGAWTEVWPSSSTMTRQPPHAPEIVPPIPEGPPTTAAHPGSAADFMLQATRRYPGQVTILAMGPLTNLALAQRLDDGFAARVKEVVVEGGDLLGHNAPTSPGEFEAQVAYAPRMAFNFYFDPEATHIVFTSPWPRLVLVTDDAASQATGTKSLLDRVTAGTGAVARYVKRIARPGYPLWDETEAAIWLDPAIATRRGVLSLDIDLMPGPNYGALLTFPEGHGPGLGEQRAEVVYGVDVNRVESLVVSRLGR